MVEIVLKISSLALDTSGATAGRSQVAMAEYYQSVYQQYKDISRAFSDILLVGLGVSEDAFCFKCLNIRSI